MAEDKHTDMAKSDKSNTRRVAIDTAHLKPTKPNLSLLQQSKNLGRMLSAATCRLVRKITTKYCGGTTQKLSPVLALVNTWTIHKNNNI